MNNRIDSQTGNSRIFYKKIVDKIPIPVIVIRQDSSIMYVNHAMENLTGYLAQEILGIKIPYPWWIRENLPKTKKGLKRAMLIGACNLKRRFKNKNGQSFQVEITSIPVRNHGIFKYYIATWINITPPHQKLASRKSMEKLIQEQQITLEQKEMVIAELLEQIEWEKQKIKDEAMTNINYLLLPVLQKIKQNSTPGEITNIKLLEKNIESLSAFFRGKALNRTTNLNPLEIEICTMIKNGFRTKDIADFLNISPRTVEWHRYKIRKKLGIRNQKRNLISFLQQL